MNYINTLSITIINMMTRATTSSYAAATTTTTRAATDQISKKFHLPSRTDKRTHASTMFGTTAWNLASNIPFRWVGFHVSIFEDWIRVKGAGAMTADLVPLLRQLDLDGYEDVRNKRGECVHDLIVVKVRRKIARIRDEVVLKGLGSLRESGAKSAVPTSFQAVRHSQERKVKPEPTNKFFAQEANYMQHPEDRVGGNTSLMDHLNAATWTANTQDLAQNPPNLISTEANVDQGGLSSYLAALGLNTSNKDPFKVHDAASHTRHHPTQASSPRTSYRVAVGRNTRASARNKKDLEACIEKLRQDMKELDLVIHRLPEDSDSLALETAAHDVGVEIDQVDKLFCEYITR